MLAPAKEWISETSDVAFEQDVIERSKEVPVVVDFWAEWCQPCQLLGLVLEKLVTDFAGKLVLVKANTDRMPDVAARFRIQAIPAVHGFRGGELRDSFVGLMPEEQTKIWLERLLPTEAEQSVAEAVRIAEDDPQGAERKYREAIELDPDLADAKFGLAKLLLADGRLDACRKLIEELDWRGFLEPRGEWIKADLMLHTGAREVDCVDECREALAADPDQPDLKLKLAKALAGAGQYGEALEASLELVQQHKQRFGEPARAIMVNVFQILPEDSALTDVYRRRLSAALY